MCAASERSDRTMATPNFSPIAALNRKFLSGGGLGGAGSRKNQSSQQDSESLRPKYQCPGCNEMFAKWSPCLAHLREKLHAAPELLDKKLNGGDFRKIQEICATLAHQRNSCRERGDSTSSADSLSSDSGGEEEETGGATSARVRPANHQLKARSAGVTSASLQAQPVPSKEKPQSDVAVTQARPAFDLRMLDEKVIFRLLTFLDVDSSRMLFLAMTVPQRPPSLPKSVRESRVRLWSMSSDPDSASSLPSASPKNTQGAPVAGRDREALNTKRSGN